MGTARLWQAASSLVLADYSSECGFQLSSLIAVGFFITWPFSKKPPFKILEFGHIHSGFLQHCAVLSNNWNICCYWKYQLFFFFGGNVVLCHLTQIPWLSCSIKTTAFLTQNVIYFPCSHCGLSVGSSKLDYDSVNNASLCSFSPTGRITSLSFSLLWQVSFSTTCARSSAVEVNTFE